MNPYNPAEYLCDLADYVNNKPEYLPLIFLSPYPEDFPELNKGIRLTHISLVKNQS